MLCSDLWSILRLCKVGTAQAASSRCPAISSRKMRDIVNFMNFAAGFGSYGPLEFAAGRATSGPE